MIFEATWDVIEAPSWTLQLIDNEAFTLRLIRERDVGLTKDLLKKLNCLKQIIRKDPLLRSFSNIVPGKRLIKGALHCITFTEAERYALFWLEIYSTYNTYTPWTFQDGSLEKRWLQQKVCLYDNMRPLFHHPTHQFQECKNFFRPVSSTFTPAFRPPQCWLWSPSPSTKSRPKLMVYGFPDFQFYTNEILKGKKKPCRFFTCFETNREIIYIYSNNYMAFAEMDEHTTTWYHFLPKVTTCYPMDTKGSMMDCDVDIGIFSSRCGELFQWRVHGLKVRKESLNLHPRRLT